MDEVTATVPITPTVFVAGLVIVLVGCLVLGMNAAVIRRHARSLRHSEPGHGRLLVWHVLLIAASHASFVFPIVLGVLDVLGVLESPQPLRFGLYLVGLGLAAVALPLVAVRIRQRDRAA